MSNPSIPQKSPFVLDSQQGSHWWCSCGQSKKQPFCDGAHKGSAFSPIKVDLPSAKKVAWCGCKHSKNGAYCDGSHSKL
jgi:CDGSH-type Zn-finger protein